MELLKNCSDVQSFKNGSFRLNNLIKEKNALAIKYTTNMSNNHDMTLRLVLILDRTFNKFISIKIERSSNEWRSKALELYIIRNITNSNLSFSVEVDQRIYSSFTLYSCSQKHENSFAMVESNSSWSHLRFINFNLISKNDSMCATDKKPQLIKNHNKTDCILKNNRFKYFNCFDFCPNSTEFCQNKTNDDSVKCVKDSINLLELYFWFGQITVPKITGFLKKNFKTIFLVNKFKLFN